MTMQRIGRRQVVLKAGGYTARTHVFAPPHALLLMARAVTAPAVTAAFQVTYTGFSPEAQAAFQAAVDVWSVTLTSSVPIRINANWTPLGPGVLGSAGPENFLADFVSAPVAATYYPIALASKITGSDLSPGSAHITADFSSVFNNWYFGTDGATPADKYDLMSVVLHELGHGLGFIGSMDVVNGQGIWGLGTQKPIIFDRFAVNALGQPLLDTSLFDNPSSALAGQLQSNQLFFESPQTRTANNGNPARLYAPSTWEQGSSFSHLDEVTYSAGDADSLMTPQLGLGEAIHAPGSITRSILNALGW